MTADGHGTQVAHNEAIAVGDVPFPLMYEDCCAKLSFGDLVSGDAEGRGWRGTSELRKYVIHDEVINEEVVCFVAVASDLVDVMQFSPIFESVSGGLGVDCAVVPQLEGT